MNTNQAKVSVETMKEVQNDKALKTKGDKDRRLREKQQNNTKKFMEERKTLQVSLVIFDQSFHFKEPNLIATKESIGRWIIIKSNNELVFRENLCCQFLLK